MKTLKPTIWKNIASILSSDNVEWKCAKNMIMFSRTLAIYPSKSPYYMTCERLMHYAEQNIRSVPLILETMRDEAEDEEIISTIEILRGKPTITTNAEVRELCYLLSDYVKYAKILKAKEPFIQTLDMMEEDDINIRETVDNLYHIANAIISAYDSASYHDVAHSFDTDNKDQMRNVVADVKDSRSSDKTIITGIRALNNLLSPGYLGGCLYIYMALPGCYKSGILLQGHVDCCKFNEHLKHTTNGKTPISMYISMENTMTQTIRRLWALLFPNSDMAMFTVDEIIEMIDKELTSKGFRSVILYYGYREKSTADLYEIIRAYNDDKHVVVALFLDYIKRIRSARTDAAATASEKSELHAIMNELKALAAQFNIPVISGHQLNRAAAQQVDDIRRAGGYQKASEVLGRSHTGSA